MSTRIVLERDVGCTLSDGTVLMADVYRPDDGERHPVLLQRTPYDRMFFPFTWPALDPTKMAAAGYVVVIQDVRGRFGSTGTYPGPYVADAADGAETIAWAAGLPWSNGSVGMYGISYMGGVQWEAAAEQPEALRAIAPITSPSEFDAGHFFRGGALQLGLVTAWTLASVAANEVVRRTATDLPALVREVTGLIDDMDTLDEHLRALPLLPFPPVDERAGGIAPWFGEMMRRGSAERPTPVHERIAVPALQIAGWYDLLVQSDLDHHVAMRERAATEDARNLSRLIVGPWAHAAFLPVVGELDFGFRASSLLLDLREDFTALHRRWFDARLKGVPTGIDDEPPVKLFVMGRNRWRSEDAWPLARAQTVRWHVHGDGSLSQRPPAEAEPSIFTLDPEDPVPTHGGQILMMPKYIRGPREQSAIEARDDVLTFTSEPLAEDLEVTGRVRFVCWVAAETADTDVVARLCDVHPDGRSYNVVDGILRLSARAAPDRPEPATPGEVYRLEVDLWSTSHVFLAGHRLRLQVRASDFPRYDRCPGTGEPSWSAEKVVPQRNRLFHDPQQPTHLELPVVPA